MRGVFVTGTGTEVGKTVVAATIARTAAARGEQVAAFKPAVTGLDESGEPDHALLRRAAGSSQADEEIAPYRYGPPVSPHLGAELADETIDPQRLLAAARRAGDGVDLLVVEGVGGFLVPLTLGYLVRDFARDLCFGVVIAGRPGLGTINHTLLTIEAVRSVGLELLAVVLTPWPDDRGAIERSNRDAIARLGGVRVDCLAPLKLSEPQSWPQLDLTR
ncbi:MAG TPA: dethiobiotin synthase [Solirubrobacterales bacterium]|nr:dethiobiotin synthase [Solirubrobacterales bacterium]